MKNLHAIITGGSSGIGRELGMHALQLYTEVKNVFVSLE